MSPRKARFAALGAALLAASGVLLLPDSGAAGESRPEKASESAVERLRRIAEEADPSRNIVLNDRRVPLARQRYEAAGEPAEKLRARLALGNELLLAGDTEEAISELKATRETLRDAPAFDGAAAMERRLTELLAVAYLRLGEQENCVTAHTAASCLMPIADEGVHRIERGSRQAIGELRRLLEDDPDHLGHRWLFNLAHMTLGRYPEGVDAALRIPPDVFASEYPLPRFRDVAPQAGADTVGLAGGAVMEDFDGDGHLDLMASSWGATDQLRYLRNEGDGTFSDRTREAGLLGQVGGLNLVQADYDNDGHVDVLVLRGAWLGFFGQGNRPNSLLRNNGDGTFRDVTEQAGILEALPTQTAAWADFDGDGWLDLFVGYESVRQQKNRCRLFRNNGDGTFSDVAPDVGLDVLGLVKGAVWGDYDNDGRPDLFLSRFGQPNLLFHNEGPTGEAARQDDFSGGGFAWRFRDVTEQAGVAEPRMSFPAWFWDYDNDGWLDLLVAPFSGFVSASLETAVADYLGLPHDGELPRVYRNRGDGTFEDMTADVGLDVPLLAMGSNFGDLDNDGFPDAYFGTGEPDLRTLVPNRMFRNDGGKKFQDVTTAGGFGHLQKGHGVAFGDVDNDGDQDLFHVVGGAYSGDVYQNVLFENPGSGNRWLTLRLQGVASNRSAIGARIRVVTTGEDGERSIHTVVSSGGSFGASSLQQEIGLGDATGVDRVEITWPATGKTQVIQNVEADGVFAIREGAAEALPMELEPFRFPSAQPDRDGHVHPARDR